MEKRVVSAEIQRRRAAWYFILAVVFVLLAVKFMFFRVEKCYDMECFESALEKCGRVVFVNDGEEATWNYEINGKSKGMCEVNVKLLQAKEAELEMNKLVGFSMDCEVPVGFVGYPEQDLDSCHGRLKEEMQAIIIKKLHAHIIDNLEEIGEEIGG